MRFVGAGVAHPPRWEGEADEFLKSQSIIRTFRADSSLNGCIPCNYYGVIVLANIAKAPSWWVELNELQTHLWMFAWHFSLAFEVKAGRCPALEIAGWLFCSHQI